MIRCIVCGVKITINNESDVPIVMPNGINDGIKICKKCVDEIGDEEYIIGEDSEEEL